MNCHFCDSPRWRTLRYQGRRTPVCVKHGRRIQRRGTHEPYEPQYVIDAKTALKLRKKGLSYAEIASAFDCSKSTVWEAAHRDE